MSTIAISSLKSGVICWGCNAQAECPGMLIQIGQVEIGVKPAIVYAE